MTVTFGPAPRRAGAAISGGGQAPRDCRSEPRSAARGRLHLVAVGALTVLCAVLGSSNRHRSIWFDEAFSVTMASSAWHEFWRTSWDQELNMVGHYLLLRAWAVLGSSIETARLLSALCAAATVPVTYLLGRRLFGSGAALLAAALLALHPALVEYGGEARAYTLVTLLVVATALALSRALTCTTWAPWALTAVLGAAAVYAHLYAVLALAVFAVSLLAVAPPANWLHRWPVTVAVLALLLAPMIIFVLGAPTAQLGWIAYQRDDAVNRSLWFLSGNSDGRLGALLVVAVFVGAVAWARTLALRGRSVESWRWLFITSWAVGPVIIAAAVSQFEPLLVPRYVLLSLPGVTLLVGALVSRLPSRPVQFFVAVPLLLILISGSAHVATYAGRERWDEVTAYLLANGGPRDGLVVVPAFQRMPLEYYFAEASPARLPIPLSPDSPWGTRALYGGSRPPPQEIPLVAERVWLVIGTTQPELDPEVSEAVQRLEGSYERVAVTTFGEVTLYQYRR